MIHHILEGPASAPVIVLGHSLGTSHRLWDPQVPALLERFRVLRCDFRGHGQSATPPGPYRMDDLGGDVLALTERLGIERFHYMGLSIGGQVGQWLALHAPERIDRLILANTAAKIGTGEHWDGRIALVRDSGLAAVVDVALERWFGAKFRAAVPEVEARARAWLLATPVEGYVGACAAIRDFDAREALPRIAAPTLVITGANDASTPQEDGRFLAARIPGARLVGVDGAHLSNLEAAGAFTAAVLEFLGADERYRKGLAVRRAVLGDAHVDRALASRTPFTSEFQELITRYAWGEMWTRPSLPRPTRSLVTLALLVALGRHEELAMHVRGALRNGVSIDEIKDLLLHTAIYCGVPAANSAFRIAAQVLAEEQAK